MVASAYFFTGTFREVVNATLDCESKGKPVGYPKFRFICLPKASARLGPAGFRAEPNNLWQNMVFKSSGLTYPCIFRAWETFDRLPSYRGRSSPCRMFSYDFPELVAAFGNKRNWSFYVCPSARFFHKLLFFVEKLDDIFQEHINSQLDKPRLFGLYNISPRLCYNSVK